MKVPSYILKFIIDFLKDRKFIVTIGDTLSKSFDILCSVPQGSVLGPILFLNFINDIPLADSKHVSYSSLFADDLSTICLFRKNGRITVTMKRYLENLVVWLFKWRLKINASKCNYTIFSSIGSRNITRFNLFINGGNHIYTFDEYIRRIWKLGLEKRLNLIKNFSHKSWKLSHETLKGIYNALIGSLFVYSFFSVARIAVTNLERLQIVQNRAIRSIYRLEWTSPTELIHSISSLLPVRDRLTDIGKKYLPKAIGNNANVCLLLEEYLDSVSSIRRGYKDTPLCLFRSRE